MSEMVILRRYQSLLGWLLLLLILLLALFFAVLPALDKSAELSEQIESGYQRLGKMRQIAAATPEFVAEYERVREQGLDKLFYPEGMTVAQVAKELQKQLSAVVARRNGLLLSSEVMEQAIDEKEQGIEGYQRVTVQAVFQGTTDLLREVLHEAYSSRPLIFVEGLEVKPLDETDAQQIRGTVRISTYWRGGAAT